MWAQLSARPKNTRVRICRLWRPPTCSAVLQALRSLEEYAKVVARQLAPGLESLRYRTYTLERAITTLHRSQRLLARARLYVLVDGRPSPAEFQALVAQLLEADVDVLQLRDKRLTDRELLARAQQLRTWTRPTQVLCIINDRVDIALAADADGVHLGQDELPVAAARRLLGSDKLIGVSTHDIGQARQAVLDGADYLGCGPTFASATKSFPAYPGLQLLRQVSGEIGLPAFAIGGIDEQNLAEVLQTGLSRVAVSQAVLGAADASQAARQLAELLHAAAQQGGQRT